VNSDQLIESAIDRPELRQEIDARELLEAFLSRIEKWQPIINTFITLTPDLARADLEQVERRRDANQLLGPLDGMVVAVKDDIDVGGVRCTVGSPVHAKRVPRADAEVVRRLRAAGALIVGKTGLHEWAYGATSDNPHFGTIRNPWDLDRIPGGSSGGSGAAVAADLCVAALGSDAGGSVRVPAALNGVTGFRPTLGSVSSRGSHPICFSLETIGPIARSARDAALMYEVINGLDAADPYSMERPSDCPFNVSDAAIDGVRIGVLGGYFAEGVDPEISASFATAADDLAALGAHVEEIVLHLAEPAYDATCLTMLRAEALAIHDERLRQQPELYGEDVRRRLELGREVSGADYARAADVVQQWRSEVRDAFERVDLLVSPSTPAVAPAIEGAETISTTQHLTRLAFPLSAARLPAISLPCGLTEAGLPIGVQVAAAPWNDTLALQAGIAYQDHTDWHRKRPAEVSLNGRRNGRTEQLATKD
jgi:aspartyl-tRNA(Asn)/glutamyl-tRNA(Gln) amidotransferase subunit A